MKFGAKLTARFGLAALFIALGACTADAAGALLPICSWPFEVTGRGITNIATPDTNATYWVTPLDTSHWKRITITGTYPQARFFNFATYTATGSLIDTIYDAQITPDARSWNPFATATGIGGDAYTVTIGAAAAGANLLNSGNGGFAFLVYRVYLPNKGLSRQGGAGLPVVTLIDNSGSNHALSPCPFADAETSLPGLIALLSASGFADAAKYLEGILALANHAPFGMCSPDQAGSQSIAFSETVPGADFFPNPQTTYFQTANLCFRSGEVLVVRGAAPVYPDTFDGGSVFDPAPVFGSPPLQPIQLRYWSMCNNDALIPYPAIACSADVNTNLEQGASGQFYYTYVISTDPAPPSWLPAGATWLPWGPTSLPITLILRDILPENRFAPINDRPTGVLCNETQLAQQQWNSALSLWQSCIIAAASPSKMP